MRILFYSILLLACTQGALAQGTPGAGGGGAGPRLDDATFRPTVATLTTMLQLTPDQARQVVPLRDSLLAHTRVARQEAMRVQKTLQAARQAGVSTDSLNVLRSQMQGIMMGMMPARMQFHSQVRALLTPDQAKILDQHQQEMLGSMGQRMQGTAPAGP